MERRKSTIMRVDKEMEKLVKEILESKPRDIKTPRLTLAMARQYDKYPYLKKELKEANLK